VGLYLLEPTLLYAPESDPRPWGFSGAPTEARRKAEEVYRRHGSRTRSFRARGVGPGSSRRNSGEEASQTSLDL